MVEIVLATRNDAEAILDLQKLAYESEARLYDDWSLPPLTQTLDSLLAEFDDSVVLKAELDGRLIGSVRARREADVCEIGRLIVHPGLQRRGIGSRLLREVESHFGDVAGFHLFTGALSGGNIRLYRSHGYQITRTEPLSENVDLVHLEKATVDRHTRGSD